MQNREVLHRGIELLIREQLQGFNTSRVAQHPAGFTKSFADIAIGGRALDDAHLFLLAVCGFFSQIFPRVDGRIPSSRAEPELIDVIGKAGEITGSALVGIFITIDGQVDFSLTQNQKHAVPVALNEHRRALQLAGERLGQINLEADDLRRVIVARINIGPASLLVGAPAQGRLVLRLVSGYAATGECEDDDTGEQPAKSSPQRAPPVYFQRSSLGSQNKANQISEHQC